MTSEFEYWLSNNRDFLHEDAFGLFSDSIRCLKNDIVRPAFLLAYQGVMVTIREAVKIGVPPVGYNECEWTHLISGVSKDNQWDEELFNIIKKQPLKRDGKLIKGAPLNIDDGIRYQFDYWRQLRNACAHYKRTTVIKANVLSFYHFIESQLLNITVEGAVDIMLAKIKTYCDPTMTPDDADIVPLLTEAVNRLSRSHLPQFVEDSIKIFAFSRRKDCISYIDTMLKLSGSIFDPLKQATIDFLRTKEELFIRLIEHDAEYVLHYCTDATKTYQFITNQFITLNNNPLGVLAQLIFAGKLSDEAISGTLKKWMQRQYKANRYILFDDSAVKTILQQKGYFNLFCDEYLTTKMLTNPSKFSEVCHSTDFYISHLYALPLDATIVKTICELFDDGNSNPYTLSERLRDEVLQDADFGPRFKALAAEAGIDIPCKLLCTTA